MRARGLLLFLAPLAAGCAALGPPAGAAPEADPLRARLIAREDLALQNILLARLPIETHGAPYHGPAFEPPLPEPDLTMLPDELPPWPEDPSSASATTQP